MTDRRNAGLARRAISGIVLLLQLVLAGAVPLADVLIDSDGPPGPHIEAAAGSPCAPVHDHQKCEFCRHQGNFGTTEVGASVAIDASTHRRATIDSPDHVLPGSLLDRIHQPRAPPSI